MSFTLLRQCSSLMEAETIHSELEGAHIDSHVQHRGTSGFGRFGQDAEVFVEQNQMQQAQRVIEDGGV